MTAIVSISGALLAMAAAVIHGSVGVIVGMPLWAMCFPLFPCASSAADVSTLKRPTSFGFFEAARIAAPRSARFNPKVSPGICMPGRAVHPIPEMLSGFSSTDILRVCNQLQMIGVDATSNTAEMVGLKPLRNLAAKVFVRPAVGRESLALGRKLPVAESYRAHPDPAATFGYSLNIAGKMLDIAGEGKLIVGHVTPFSRIGRGRCDVQASRGPQAILPQWGMA